MEAIRNYLYDHFAKGILDSNLSHFGGEECYQTIPRDYHIGVCIVVGLIYLICFVFWHKTLNGHQNIPKKAPNLIQKITFWAGLISYVYTFERKFQKGQAFFMFNPCHTAILIQLVLLMVKDNTRPWIKKLHTIWTAWVFGAFGAFAWPHLENLQITEIVLYYVQHLVLLPFGSLALHRRYGTIAPTFKNQTAAFTPLLLYQVYVLTPFSRWNKVNINFSLCASPAEPFWPPFGYHYFTIECFFCWIVSVAIRWIMHLYTKLLCSHKPALKEA